MSRYEEIYNTAKGVMNGSVDIELPAISVFVILVLSLIYMVTTSISIDVYSRCSDVKGKKMYDTLFKYMSHSLVAALTIPLTLVLTKMFNNDTGAFMMLYGILGLVVSLAAVDLTRKCNIKDQLKVMWSRFSLGLHTIVLLVGLFLSAKTVT
jgi:hypothetical protein